LRSEIAAERARQRAKRGRSGASNGTTRGCQTVWFRLIGVTQAESPVAVTTSFTWNDGPRTIRFGRGLRESFGEHVEPGYALLWSRHGAEAVPELAEGAESVHDVAPGFVDQVAAGLVPAVAAERVVAVGGGRVIDTAKAVAGAHGATVAAIPTTLSSAEMTWIHRFAAGYEQQSKFIRPTRVLNDPAISASQPKAGLAASSANALAHAVEGRVSALGHPAARAVAVEAESRIAAGWRGEPDDAARDELALGALLSGWVIDTAWYGLHHVLSQTLVRLAELQHGTANAVLLPHTIDALQRRVPSTDRSGELRDLARRLARVAGAASLKDLGVEQEALAECADAANARPELAHTPPRAELEEINRIYRAAFAGID
jgi:alcohol dehydrogenase class IV